MAEAPGLEMGVADLADRHQARRPAGECRGRHRQNRDALVYTEWLQLHHLANATQGTTGA